VGVGSKVAPYSRVLEPLPPYSTPGAFRPRVVLWAAKKVDNSQLDPVHHPSTRSPQEFAGCFRD
jgi:hypothetical protein